MKQFLLLVILLSLTACTVASLPPDEAAQLANDLGFLITDRVGVYYTVKHGDSLWSIATTYQVTVDDIMRENQDVLKGSRVLKSGQILFIPSVKTQPEPPLPTESEFIWPVKGTLLGGASTKGIKIKAQHGAPVKAVKSGLIIYTGEEPGLGKTVIIKHSDNFTSLYCYNSEILVKLEQLVKQGEVIARAGETGRAEESQLFFMLMKGDKLVNPLSYLK